MLRFGEVIVVTAFILAGAVYMGGGWLDPVEME